MSAGGGAAPSKVIQHLWTFSFKSGFPSASSLIHAVSFALLICAVCSIPVAHARTAYSEGGLAETDLKPQSESPPSVSSPVSLISSAPVAPAASAAPASSTASPNQTDNAKSTTLQTQPPNVSASNTSVAQPVPPSTALNASSASPSPAPVQEPLADTTEIPTSQTSSVHARKGVSDPPQSSNDTKLPSNKTPTTKPPPPPKPINATSSAQTASSTTPKPIPKKPLITISSFDMPPAVKPAKPVIPSSVSPPVVEFLKTEKSSILSSIDDKPRIVGNHSDQPSYVIPLIITMFAVPLLGLVGYQAVRRGKEAWKNRHYRRMDYLIDGMYNDT